MLPLYLISINDILCIDCIHLEFVWVKMCVCVCDDDDDDDGCVGVTTHLCMLVCVCVCVLQSWRGSPVILQGLDEKRIRKLSEGYALFADTEKQVTQKKTHTHTHILTQTNSK